MIVYIRSSLISKDVRVQKYIHYLNATTLIKIQWDRKGEYKNTCINTITFDLPAEYGERIKSLFKFLRWNIFVFRTLFQQRNKIKVIQICDLDSFFGAIPFRLFGKKIVFDVYDFFTDSKISRSGGICYSTLYQIEMFCLRFVDLLILPLEVRKKHLNFNPKRMIVCENVPLLNGFDAGDKCKKSQKLEVIYTGTLEAENRGLEWIPVIAKKLRDKVNFTIAGDGALKDFFKEAALENSNILFLGTVTHNKALELQRNGDLIYAIYRTNLTNNILAAPNKFYESLFLGTPVIINKGILIAELVEINKIGYVVAEKPDAVIELLQSVKEDEIKKVSESGINYWSINYATYLEKKYCRDYQDQLALLTS
jgi:glycosyltransferase involved in cell wall biosynthesis